MLAAKQRATLDVERLAEAIEESIGRMGCGGEPRPYVSLVWREKRHDQRVARVCCTVEPEDRGVSESSHSQAPYWCDLHILPALNTKVLFGGLAVWCILQVLKKALQEDGKGSIFHSVSACVRYGRIRFYLNQSEFSPVGSPKIQLITKCVKASV